MTAEEHLALVREVLGRDVDENYEPTFEEYRAIRAAEAERDWKTAQAKVEAERADAEHRRKLRADPLYERRELAAKLREDREAREAKRRDAVELVNAEFADQIPCDASELDERDLYRLAYNEGRELDPDYLKDSVEANAAAALAPPAKTDAEITADIYRDRWAKEKAAYDSLHTDTEGRE